MPNIFENTDLVASTFIDDFENELTLAKLVSREWEPRFGVEGSKIGDHIDLRRPNNTTVTVGNKFAAQNIEDAVRRLTIDTPLHVDYELTNQDLSLEFDRAEERYFQPAARRLANEIDLRIASLYKKVSNFVGTYNTAPTALTDFSSAMARLDQFGVPRTDRHFVLDPLTMNSAFIAMSGIVQETDRFGKQYDDGRVMTALNAGWHVGQNIRAHTSGADADETDVVVATAPSSGATTIAMSGYTATTTAALKEGDMFTIAGVNAVNAITGEDLGILRQFVVTSDMDADGSGNITIPFDPPMTSSGSRKTVTALPAVGAALVHVTLGASVVANQPFYFHKNWATLVIAPQPMVNGTGAKMKMVTAKGVGGRLGIRYAFWFDGDENTWKIRFDCLIGLLAQMPEFCCRLGAA